MPQSHDFSTLSALWREAAHLPRRLGFRAQSHAEWATWRDAAQSRLRSLLGEFPAQRTPLDATLLDSQEFGDYRQEKVAFHSGDGVFTAWQEIDFTEGKQAWPHCAMIKLTRIRASKT